MRHSGGFTKANFGTCRTTIFVAPRTWLTFFVHTKISKPCLLSDASSSFFFLLGYMIVSRTWKTKRFVLEFILVCKGYWGGAFGRGNMITPWTWWVVSIFLSPHIISYDSHFFAFFSLGRVVLCRTRTPFLFVSLSNLFSHSELDYCYFHDGALERVEVIWGL